MSYFSFKIFFKKKNDEEEEDSEETDAVDCAANVKYDLIETRKTSIYFLTGGMT